MTPGNEMRRFDDLVAFQFEETQVAFHASSLEVAEISEEAFHVMPRYTFNDSFIPTFTSFANSSSSIIESEAYQQLQDWSQQFQSESNSTKTQIDTSSAKQTDIKLQSMTINVTQLCNLHCSYCAAGGDGTYGDPVAKISIEKTLPQLSSLLSRLGPEDHFSLTMLGGEPLLYPAAVVKIIAHVKGLAKVQKFKLRLNLITNGTLITDDLARFLYESNTQITISMDGPPEVNDVARPTKDKTSSSQKTLEGLALLLKYKCQVLIHSVFTKTHLDVLSTYQFFSSFPVKMEFTLDLMETDLQTVQMFTKAFSDVAKLAYEKGHLTSLETAETELRRITLFDGYFNQLDRQSRLENHCGSGKSLLAIDSRNQVYECPLEVGSIENQIGKDLELRIDAFDQSSKSLIELNNCKTCWARHLCGGGCMFSHKSMTGNKHQKDLAYCMRTRHLISLALLYYLKIRST